MKVGQIIKLAVLGFLFFFFVAVDLVLFGVIPLNSVMVTLLPLIGMLLCGLLGVLASRGGKAPAPVAAGGEPMAPPPPPM
ncbi:MAG TPA: hypothetical protein PLV13_03790 [Ilumatobacteraceae bacterium]|nr:hypothetical protein [Ilumatobacteraceae bacterium]